MQDRLSTLLQMLEASPTDPFLLFALAKEYEKAGDDAQALRYYETVRSTNPGYLGLYYHLGKLFERVERFSEAVSCFKEGIALAQQQRNAHAAAELATALLAYEDPDDE